LGCYPPGVSRGLESWNPSARTYLTTNFSVAAMNAIIPNDLDVDILSKLFVRSPRAFSQEEARLFVLALKSLTQNSQQVTFQLAFSDIIPGSNEDGKQYAKLLVATKRLMQAINFKTFQQGNNCSEYLLLFSTLGMNADTTLITGKFNPDLKAYLLDLGNKFTTADLESLLVRRQ
jgi:hypothetical protein